MNTVFAKILGINSFSVTATSTASMGGGKPTPAHIMIVLDRTGSMNSSCSAGGTKLSCAKAGDQLLPGWDGSCLRQDRAWSFCRRPARPAARALSRRRATALRTTTTSTRTATCVVGLSDRLQDVVVLAAQPELRRWSRTSAASRAAARPRTPPRSTGAGDLARQPRPEGAGRDRLLHGRRGDLRPVRRHEPEQRRLRQQQLALSLAALPPGDHSRPRPRRTTRPPRRGSTPSSMTPADDAVQGLEVLGHRDAAFRRVSGSCNVERGHPVPRRLLRVAVDHGLRNGAAMATDSSEVLLLAEPGLSDDDLPEHRRRHRRSKTDRQQLHGKLALIARRFRTAVAGNVAAVLLALKATTVAADKGARGRSSASPHDPDPTNDDERRSMSYRMRNILIAVGLAGLRSAAR